MFLLLLDSSKKWRMPLATLIYNTTELSTTIDSVLGQSDAMRESYKQKLEKLGLLMKSILQKAFNGQLESTGKVTMETNNG